jgi:hypothetical protein
MGCLGQMHDNKGNACCETDGEPLEPWEWVLLEIELENSCNNHTDQTTEEVTEDESSWLCQWNVNGTIAKNCRSTLSYD